MALLILYLAVFGCFTGFMFVMGYWEFHDRKELKQGLIILISSLSVLAVCCVYFAHWAEELGPVDTHIEYPTVLEPIYE